MNQRNFFLGFFFLIILATYYYQTSPSLWANIIVKQEPDLKLVNKGPSWKADDYEGYVFTTMATLNIRAKVLDKHVYHWWDSDEEALLSPEDLFLAWGNLSDNNEWGKMDFSKSWTDDRSYYFELHGSHHFSSSYIASHSKVAHVIPANKTIKSILKQVGVNDIVDMKGDLVNVYSGNNFVWKSGLNKDALGPHSCFVFFIKDIKIEN